MHITKTSVYQVTADPQAGFGHLADGTRIKPIDAGNAIIYHGKLGGVDFTAETPARA